MTTLISPPETSTPTTPDQPSAAGAWRIVATREITAKLTDRAFLVGTVLTLAVIAGIVAVQAYLGSRDSTYDLVVTSANQSMAQAMADQAPALDDSMVIRVEVAADDAAARAAVLNDDADAWLSQQGDAWQVAGKSEVPTELMQVASVVVPAQALEANAERLGASVAELTAGSAVTSTVLDGDADANAFGRGVGFAMAILFYMSSLGFGLTLAQSVLEEKASRIVEIIATKIPVRQLLIGKIAGNVIMALAQMALYTGVGLIGLTFTPYSEYLPSLSGALGWFLIFFVVGFGVVACAWAVVGALASRSEDLQQSTMPLTMVTMAMFFGAIFLQGTWLTIGSFVPPFSAILMPVRLVQGTAAWWEPLAALALLLLMAALIVNASERLYRRSLLQTQGRLSIRRAWALGD